MFISKITTQDWPLLSILGGSSKDFRIKGRIRIGGFLRIFTVAFLLFLAPTGGCNPAGQSFNTN